MAVLPMHGPGGGGQSVGTGSLDVNVTAAVMTGSPLPPLAASLPERDSPRSPLPALLASPPTAENGTWEGGPAPPAWWGGGTGGLGVLPLVYYSGLLSLGLPANALTLLVLLRLLRRRHKSCYSYLLALAAADTITLLLVVLLDLLLLGGCGGAAGLGPPPSAAAVSSAGPPGALLRLLGVLQFGANHACVWTAVPLTADRYVAVCRPLRYCSVSFPARARRVIVSVYAASLASAVPFYWWPDAWGRGGGAGGSRAAAAAPLHRALLWFHCLAAYFVPCALLLALNGAIVRRLRRRRGRRGVAGGGEGGGRTGLGASRPRHGKPTAVLLAVSAAFVLLWAPRVAVALYRAYAPPGRDAARLAQLAQLAHMVALLNAALDFWLYCFVSRRFRRAAALTLRAMAPCAALRGGPRRQRGAACGADAAGMRSGRAARGAGGAGPGGPTPSSYSAAITVSSSSSLRVSPSDAPVGSTTRKLPLLPDTAEPGP
ncbi:putative G-protein coupled receptor 139 isoform X1 [Lampetra fluviatilis]